MSAPVANENRMLAHTCSMRIAPAMSAAAANARVRGNTSSLGVWHVTTPNELVLPLTLAFAAAALIAGAIRMLQVWASMRFSFATGADISVEVYRRTLYQPYRVHVARGSDEVISGITQKAGTVV